MDQIRQILDQIKFAAIEVPKIQIKDIIEIFIIGFLIYRLISWIKDTRAWTLFKGLLVIFIMWAIALFFQLNTILWILTNTVSVGIIAIIIVFQPELRRALEQLGRGGLLSSLLTLEDYRDRQQERISVQSVEAVIRAVEEMAQRKVGALIAIEQDVKLGEYERTGIMIDAEISSQLLLNIFEDKTPLHDGAVIIRDNRIAAATCYLPLTDSLEISKELGTRHRAALGLSEVSDSIIIVVSEETGKISVASGGNLVRNVNREYLKSQLTYVPKKKIDKKRLVLWKGRKKHE
ncbi:MAG: TIGR00159 family protein [Epulopiscium sp.]|nr:TIGR00159 family protein [Candidatus Epulonipiscium sp.]